MDNVSGFRYVFLQPHMEPDVAPVSGDFVDFRRFSCFLGGVVPS